LSMIRGSQNLSPRTMERGIRFLVLISFYTFCKLFMVSENCIIIVWYFSSICVDTRISWSGVLLFLLLNSLTGYAVLCSSLKSTGRSRAWAFR
jgi:hypothetical protein